MFERPTAGVQAYVKAKTRGYHKPLSAYSSDRDLVNAAAAADGYYKTKANANSSRMSSAASTAINGINRAAPFASVGAIAPSDSASPHVTVTRVGPVTAPAAQPAPAPNSSRVSARNSASTAVVASVPMPSATAVPHVPHVIRSTTTTRTVGVPAAAAAAASASASPQKPRAAHPSNPNSNPSPNPAPDTHHTRAGSAPAADADAAAVLDPSAVAAYAYLQHTAQEMQMRHLQHTIRMQQIDADSAAAHATATVATAAHAAVERDSASLHSARSGSGAPAAAHSSPLKSARAAASATASPVRRRTVGFAPSPAPHPGTGVSAAIPTIAIVPNNQPHATANVTHAPAPALAALTPSKFPPPRMAPKHIHASNAAAGGSSLAVYGTPLRPQAGGHSGVAVYSGGQTPGAAGNSPNPFTPEAAPHTIVVPIVVPSNVSRSPAPPQPPTATGVDPAAGASAVAADIAAAVDAAAAAPNGNNFWDMRLSTLKEERAIEEARENERRAHAAEQKAESERVAAEKAAAEAVEHTRRMILAEERERAAKALAERDEQARKERVAAEEKRAKELAAQQQSERDREEQRLYDIELQRRADPLSVYQFGNHKRGATQAAHVTDVLRAEDAVGEGTEAGKRLAAQRKAETEQTERKWAAEQSQSREQQITADHDAEWRASNDQLQGAVRRMKAAEADAEELKSRESKDQLAERKLHAEKRAAELQALAAQEKRVQSEQTKRDERNLQHAIDCEQRKQAERAEWAAEQLAAHRLRFASRESAAAHKRDKQIELELGRRDAEARARHNARVLAEREQKKAERIEREQIRRQRVAEREAADAERKANELRAREERRAAHRIAEESKRTADLEARQQSETERYRELRRKELDEHNRDTGRRPAASPAPAATSGGSDKPKAQRKAEFKSPEADDESTDEPNVMPAAAASRKATAASAARPPLGSTLAVPVPSTNPPAVSLRGHPIVPAWGVGVGSIKSPWAITPSNSTATLPPSATAPAAAVAPVAPAPRAAYVTVPPNPTGDPALTEAAFLLMTGSRLQPYAATPQAPEFVPAYMRPPPRSSAPDLFADTKHSARAPPQSRGPAPPAPAPAPVSYPAWMNPNPNPRASASANLSVPAEYRHLYELDDFGDLESFGLDRDANPAPNANPSATVAAAATGLGGLHTQAQRLQKMLTQLQSQTEILNVAPIQRAPARVQVEPALPNRSLLNGFDYDEMSDRVRSLIGAGDIVRRNSRLFGPDAHL